jgi:Ca2+-binding RTX toxin-like protein
VTDLTSFHVYRMEWYPTVVRWFIDGQLVREDTTHVPQDPMALHANIWAPQTDWSEAYSALLQPTSNSAFDATYFFDIDYVRVTSLALPPHITRGTLGGDLIFGSDDHFPGAAYDEIFYGNGGADIIYAGGGNDWVWASTSDNSNVTFFGQDGADVLVGFGGNDWLQGDAGNDILISGAGNDTLLGGAGNDSLWGGAGDDNLQGGDGNDVLVGGLVGEPGND